MWFDVIDAGSWLRYEISGDNALSDAAIVSGKRALCWKLVVPAPTTPLWPSPAPAMTMLIEGSTHVCTQAV